MMIYPESYAHLSDEEMEYVSGGLSLNINWWGLASTAAGLGTTMLVYLNIANIAAISAQLQQQDPDKYPEPEGTINGNLLMDSVKGILQHGARRCHGPCERCCRCGHGLPRHQGRQLSSGFFCGRKSTGHFGRCVL